MSGCECGVSEKTKNVGMIIDSAIEELGAIKVYSERSDASTDEMSIRDLKHARREEARHFWMFARRLAEMDGGFMAPCLEIFGIEKFGEEVVD